MGRTLNAESIAQLLYLDSLTHPLTRMVLTSSRIGLFPAPIKMNLYILQRRHAFFNFVVDEGKKFFQLLARVKISIMMGRSCDSRSILKVCIRLCAPGLPRALS